MSAMRWLPESAAKVGFSSCISPIPCCCTSSSTSEDLGHPLFGSSSSSPAYPVGVVVAREIASSLARHTLERSAWSKAAWSAGVAMSGGLSMAYKLLYICTVV
jgi:hypothetical protein